MFRTSLSENLFLKTSAECRLQEIEPFIRRRIQIPAHYSFWDLHVAIQDVMGWSDSHLHQFSITDPNAHKEQWMGIPEENNFEDGRTLPGWEYRIEEYLARNDEITYLYDFGDSWLHKLKYEGSYEKQPGGK